MVSDMDVALLSKFPKDSRDANPDKCIRWTYLNPSPIIELTLPNPLSAAVQQLFLGWNW